MRVGQNPAKYVKTVARPERITVAVLNYIPFISGFYSEALDVLKVCLNSARKDPVCHLTCWCSITVLRRSEKLPGK